MTTREQHEDGDRNITHEGRHEGPAERTAREQNRRRALEDRWQRTWERLGVFRARDDGERERRYLLTMFPYPSGDLHMGHAEVFALEDVLARYWRARGYDVLNPVGWDSFGLPAENAAIRSGASPAEYTYANIETQAASMRRYGVSFDWSRRLHTSDPEYYRWTQWLFLRMRERGLVYRATAPANWCPADQTVLANEQVVAGRCERCGAEVVRRELTQWFVRITAYAQRLLDDMEHLGGWPERILAMQRHWIGRSEGVLIDFDVASGRDGARGPERAAGAATVPVFTTRPETLPGVTFVAVAPDGDLAEAVCDAGRREALVAYRAALGSDRERAASGRAPSGVFLGVHAAHPVTGALLPVYAADYVLPHHGTGAVMGVPAHDERDRAFARAYGLPVVEVVETVSAAGPVDDRQTDARLVERLIRSGGPGLDLKGLSPAAAAERVADWAERTGRGRRHVAYRLRDWLVSRQRYWGTPIPIVHCPACGEVPVPDDELPVRLPELRGADLVPRGTAPLESATDWVAVPCPRCGGAARRDSDTMDTFVDSSWYFFRYCSPHAGDAPFDAEAARRWLPVDTYVGGAEHAILHLLYVRFMTKVLHDLGLTDVVEPFTHLMNQGQVINRGKSMSKSLGNGVDLGAQLDRYGVDAVRLAMVFAGPPADDVDWADVRPEAMQRFLGRALRLADDVGPPSPDDADRASPRDGVADARLRAATHRTVRAAEELIEAGRFNVVIARLMELTTRIRMAIDSGPEPGPVAGPGPGPGPGAVAGPGLEPGPGAGEPAVREAVEALAVVLSLFAPYTGEEMWERVGRGPSVALAPWPQVDESLLVQNAVEAVVQVGGKVRDRLVVPVDVGEAELVERALALPGVRRALVGREITRTIVRAPHLVNLVLGAAPAPRTCR